MTPRVRPFARTVHVIASVGCLGAVVGFLEAIGFAIDGDNLGVVDKTIDQRDHTSGVGEYLTPFSEWSVGCDQRAFVLIAP